MIENKQNYTRIVGQAYDALNELHHTLANEKQLSKEQRDYYFDRLRDISNSMVAITTLLFGDDE